MRIVVFGGRTFGIWMKEELFILSRLDRVYATEHPTFLIEGGANGVDRAARRWAVARRIKFKTYVARWGDIERPGAIIKHHPDGKKYDAAAGVLRNQRMIEDGKPDIGVRFPGGGGTADMGARLAEAGIRVIDFTDDWSQ